MRKQRSRSTGLFTWRITNGLKCNRTNPNIRAAASVHEHCRYCPSESDFYFRNTQEQNLRYPNVTDFWHFGLKTGWHLKNSLNDLFCLIIKTNQKTTIKKRKLCKEPVVCLKYKAFATFISQRYRKCLVHWYSPRESN